MKGTFHCKPKLAEFTILGSILRLELERLAQPRHTTQAVQVAHRYPDCPISASLYSSVEATANAWPIKAKTGREMENRITNVGRLKDLERESKV